MSAPFFRRDKVTDFLSHAYIWIMIGIFIVPFLSLLARSLTSADGSTPMENFQYAFGQFGSYILLSLMVTAATLAINLALSLPSAYAFVRFDFPGKNALYSVMTMSLYVPGSVIGLALLMTYTFTYHITSVLGLILAMVTLSFPLMLFPIVIAMRDLPPLLEEAAESLGATKWQIYWRVVFPLIGTGVTSGLMLSFIIVFNDYIVTLFIAPPGVITAPLQIFNQAQRVGLQPNVAALAVTMQVISIIAVFGLFKVFGNRYTGGRSIL